MINQKILRALLFDTRSIQRYICSGDRLRTNIGASYIVDRLFDDILIVCAKCFRTTNFRATRIGMSSAISTRRGNP